MEPKVIMMAALGRALYTGMLYDCRSDSFIPGVTLWDKKALRNDSDVHDQTKTYVKISASDNLREKASLLDVSASLKASFFGGLIEVGGSAKYLNDKKSSAQQCRVTMQFSQTTKFEQLTMKELGNIAYPQVFEQKTATHVVTAVLYGASAFMVFDYKTSLNESKQAAEGNLQAVVKKIPTLSIEGQASLKMNQDEKNVSENISVTFYGDYELDENPTTYSEALRACKKLPTLLKERNSKGVPVTVWLYPLSLLDNRAAKLVREISLSLVGKVENLMEELNEVERKANDLLKNPTTYDFPDIRERLQQFHDLHGYYKVAFQKALVTVLPGIRSGTLEDKALGDILNKHYASPFTATNMNTWLDNISSELYILNSYTSGLKDLTVVKSSGSINSILFNPEINVVVCLSFTSLNSDDSYLEALQEFVNSEGFANTDQNITVQDVQPWFLTPAISGRMKQNLSLFTSFSKVNKNEKKMKFIVASIPDPNNPGTSIRLYQNGLLKDAKFLPVSKPPKPTGVIGDGKITLNLSASPTGKTDKFRVEYRTTTPAEDDQWKVTLTPDAQSSFTLTGLQPADQYWVRYRAVSNVGVGEASDSVAFNFIKKPELAPTPWDFSRASFFNDLRNKIMTNMGMSRWSASTIKSEIQNAINSPSIPYTDTITGGVKVGMAFYFQGVALSDGNNFEINLIAGAKETGDVIFHMYFHLAENYFACNTRRNGNWESVERTAGCPVSKGSAFDIFLVTKTEGYEIYVNGQKKYLFKNRMAMEKITTLHIYGNVIMNIMGTVPNWSASTFGKELSSGTSRSKASNIQSDVPKPVCNPNMLYNGKIPGPMTPGVALFFQGVVPSDCFSFSINLMTSPKFCYDTALHFLPCMDKVVFNTCRNGTWESEIQSQACPFVKGGAFDLFIVANAKGYEIIVNGMAFCTFSHRMPLASVNSVQIQGDVFINKFGYIGVDNVIMQGIFP